MAASQRRGDYDDLSDRMRAGFAFQEVQEPAIDVQLAWFEHNQDYMERVFQRGQRYMYHVITEEARGMPLEFALPRSWKARTNRLPTLRMRRGLVAVHSPAPARASV